MASDQTTPIAPYDPPPAWVRGRAIWASRSCGDCANGPPCRCSDKQFMDTLAPDQKRCVEAWFLKAAEEGLHL